jgi:hypothetical protein
MKWNCWNGPSPLGHVLPGLAQGRSRGDPRCSTVAVIPVNGGAMRWGRGLERWPMRWGGGHNLVTNEGGGPPQGGVHGGVAQPEGNGGEGRRPVLEVGGSRLGKVVGTRAVIGAASTERVRGQRLLGSGRRLEQRQMVGGRAKRTR